MYGSDRPRSNTPEDRVLRWVGSVFSRFPRGIPNDRFVRQLKDNLTGITYAQLEQILKTLESHGWIRRDWDSPGEFRVFATEAGLQRAKALEEPAPAAPRPSTAAPAFTPTPIGPSPRPVPSPAVPAGPGSTSPVAAPPGAAAGFRPVPLVPSPGPATSSAPPSAIEPPPSASPDAVASPMVPSPPLAEPASGMPATVRGASTGRIPSKGPPSSANLPVRILLYSLLYGAGRDEQFPLVPGEDLARYLFNQGFLLSEEDLLRIFRALESQDLLSYLARSAGGYDLQLSPRGRAMAEGLLSGQAPAPSSPAPAGGASTPAVPEAPLGPADGPVGAMEAPKEGSPTLAPPEPQTPESERLRTENESLRAALAESEERRKQDRETLDEVLHQIELQDEKVAQLQELVARLSRGAAEPATEVASDPPDPSSPSADAPPPSSS